MLKFINKIKARLQRPKGSWAAISPDIENPLFEPKENWESLAFSDVEDQLHQPPKFAKKWTKKKIALLSVAAMFVIVTGGAGLAGWQYLERLGLSENKQLIKKITDYKSPDNSIVYDRDGAKIGEFFERYQIFIPYEQMPKKLVEAVIAIEDANFFLHSGVDYKAIARAAWIHLSGKPYSQGASTISQQLVRQFLLTREKTIDRKLREASLAIELEHRLSKEKILELYLNNLFLGNGAYGVGAAALRYFGKDLQQLDTAELALIAGLFQSPSNYNPQKYPARAKARQKQVLQAMARNKFLAANDLKLALAKKLKYETYKSANLVTAPYFVDYIKDQTHKLLGKDVAGSGLRIYTTLDSRLQQIAAKSITNAEVNLQRVEVVNKTRGYGSQVPPQIEAALLSVDPTTGEILAMMGGRDYNKSQFNRTTQSLRSPGSAFKPIIFSLALHRGSKWSDLMYVDPIRVKDYRPRNSDNDYLSETTLLRAFYRSMNTPTVELGEKLGMKNVVEYAQKLGVQAQLKEEAGTVLGASEVSMLDLARVYGTFANQGTLVETTAITKITDLNGTTLYEREPTSKIAKQVMSPQLAFLMTQGMRAVLDRGTGVRSSELAEIAAGKTGTSNNSEDNWFCGYTPNLVTIAWVGADNHVPIDGRAAGNTLALPIWDDFIKQSLTVRNPGSFTPPEGIVSMRIHPQYGHQDDTNGIDMYFLENNAPSKRYSALQKLQQSGGSYRRIFSN